MSGKALERPMDKLRDLDEFEVIDKIKKWNQDMGRGRITSAEQSTVSQNYSEEESKNDNLFVDPKYIEEIQRLKLSNSALEEKLEDSKKYMKIFYQIMTIFSEMPCGKIEESQEKQTVSEENAIKSESENLRKNLSQNIKIQRKKLGVSQEKLAELIDMSPQTINDIEGCRTWISDKTMRKLAWAFKIEAYQLLTPVESPETVNPMTKIEQLRSIEERLINTIHMEIDKAIKSKH